MDTTLETVINRHLSAENAHRMEETLAELHPDCLFEDLPLGKTYRGRAGAEAYYRLWWDAFDLEVKGERRHWSEDGAFMIAQTGIRAPTAAAFSITRRPAGLSASHSRSSYRSATV
jgi:hypothetical protein